MDFKIDENLPTDVAHLLRQVGHRASTALEQGLGGASDSERAAVCQKEGLALITLDRDFADIR